MYWVLYLFITRVWVTAFWNHGFVHFSQNGNAAIKKYFPARIIQSSVETATTKPVTTEVSNSSSSVIPEVVASAVAAAVATQNIMKASQLSLWQKKLSSASSNESVTFEFFIYLRLLWMILCCGSRVLFSGITVAANFFLLTPLF